MVEIAPRLTLATEVRMSAASTVTGAAVIAAAASEAREVGLTAMIVGAVATVTVGAGFWSTMAAKLRN